MENKKVEDVRHILSVLGAEGVLDTLLCIREIEPATASEVAERMNTHVATAVKRLSGLHEIGLVESNIRKGKTRSAKEYTLVSSSFGLDIDLDALSGDFSGGKDDVGAYPRLVDDMAERFARFSGMAKNDVIAGWRGRLELPDWLFGESASMDGGADEALGAIARIIDLESAEYGEMAARAVAKASLESVIGSSELRELIGTEIFGGIE